MKNTLRFITLALIALLSSPLAAQPTDLFISEYVEGSSFNKALELYNGTNAPIDLGTGQYVLEVYFNGSVNNTSLALTGTVAAGGTFILAHPSATLGVVPNVTTTVVNFNGDDAIVLRKGGSGGPVLDVIGQVGFDPGTQWGANDTTTLDRTIRRKIGVCQGDVTTTNLFFVQPEWDGFPQNTFNGLGSHTVSCGPPPGGLSVLPASLSFTSIPGLPSAPQSYVVTGNNLTNAVTITVPSLFEISLSASGPFLSSLSIPSASLNPGNVTVFVRFSPIAAGNAAGTATHTSSPFTATLGLSGISLSITPISQIQGTGSASPLANQAVATEGIVTLSSQGATGLGGFFIQDPIGDNNPLSSEGIFISNTTYTVVTGDKVKLSGIAEEFFARTQIKSVSSLTVLSTGNLIAVTAASLPVTSLNDLEKLEGMRVVFQQSLSVTEVYALARYGEVALSANGRLFNPTNFVDPNDQPASGLTYTGTSNAAAVVAQQNANNLSRILLDDRSNLQNPPLVPYVDPINNTLRCGSTITNLDGIMDYAFSVYRIQPIVNPVFNYAPRPAVPSVGNYNVKISSFNVLNYFNGDGIGGGFPTSRGANTALEFGRQRTKIIEAIKQINADVVGLMEMENDGNSAQSAIQDLVNGLNTSMGAGTYTFVTDPTVANGGTGTDEIKVAMIYKPAVLSPIGTSIADNNPVHNRPPLAQSFLVAANQEKFSVIVNHFKSKSCGTATGSDADQNDGQGCYNNARKLQATALLNFINTITTQSGDNDVLVMGDLNAYEQEDPIDLLLSGGLNPLLTNAYSYVFDGQSGSLDHALVSNGLLTQVVGADKWHINADEPIAKDYNQEFNPAYMYSADPFRSSDHDPVIIGLWFGSLPIGLNSQSPDAANIQIYPNPAQQKASLKVPSKNAGTTLVELYDGLGRLILQQSCELKQGNTLIDLNLQGFNGGLYYVSINAEGHHQVQKLVIAP